VPQGFGGETRDQRIVEFLAANPDKTVVGLREGTMLKYENDTLVLIGSNPAKVFRFGIDPLEFGASDNINFLLH
jgi:dipeptidase E